jgi:hypothetical protein
MVILYTTRFHIKTFCVLPTQCICVLFFTDLIINSHYSLINRQLVVLITKLERAYRSVRAEPLNIYRVDLSLKC